MGQQSFVESVIAVWQELEPALVGVLTSSKVKRMADGSKIGIEIQTQHYLALVEAWENATCLDTVIHGLNTKHGTILAAGPSVGQHELMLRLLTLRDALLSKPNA